MAIINTDNIKHLYHATFGCYKDDILKNGLVPSPLNSAWFPEEYENVFDTYPIFLTNDMDVAISIVESSDSGDKEFNSGIVCFEVNGIDADLLYVDPFYHKDFDGEEIEDLHDVGNINVVSFAYLSAIPPECLRIVKEEQPR